LRQREVAINNLNQAFQAFKTLSDNFREGIQFYTEFADVLKKVKAQVDDFVFARSAEKKEYLKELSNAIANTAAPMPPMPQSGVWCVFGDDGWV
jgi:programmed cell death 6-interacting protein